ncbi:MAG: trypsin-like serine protease [Cyanobacteria bacterium P01_D01_bin.73]
MLCNVVAIAQAPGDISQNATAQSVDDFELPTVDLALTSEDSPGTVPEGLNVSLNPTAEGERGVVGSDNRTIMTSADYPWSAIGRLERRDAEGKGKGWCTASLIGPDTILTNAHCIVDKKTHSLRRVSYTFRPNMIRGESADSTSAKVVDYGKGWSRGEQDEDWAILELDDALGLLYGELGWYDPDLSDRQVREALDTRIFLAGYSRDFPNDVPGYEPAKTPGIHRNCSITSVNSDGRIFHNCDTNPGASGSALIARLKGGKIAIVGLHAGSIKRQGKVITNYAMQVNRWKKSAQSRQW